jgi:hypothetical protein
MFGEWEEDDPPNEGDNSGLKSKKKLLQEIRDLVKESNNETMKQIEQEKEIAALHGDTLRGLEAQKAQLNQLLNARNKLATRSSEMSEEQIAALQAEIDMLEKIEKQMLQFGETAEEQMKNLEKATNASAKAGASAGQAFFGGIATKLGMASNAADTWTGKLNEFTVKMKDPDFAKNFIAKFRQIFTLQNMVGAGMMMIVQATVSLILATDKASAAFSKSTGTGKSHQDTLYAVGGQYRHLGITTDDAKKSIGALYKGFPGYTAMTKSNQEAMAVTVATMEKLGVAVEDTTEMIDSFTKSQSLTADQAMRMAESMALEAEALQMTAGDYIKGFNQANKVLAVYGNRSPKIFRNIAIAAQKAGVETGKLLQLAGKFDTFSDSAESAGKLNAILGTQFSATKLLRMEEDERIETVIRGINASGRQFKDMDRFTQKAIAQTLGIDDLNEARKILGSDVSGYRKMQKDAEAAAKKEEDLKKKAQDAMDAQQKLTMAFMQFAEQMAPALEAFQSFAQAVLDFTTQNKSWLGPLIKFSFIFMAIFKILGPFLSIFKILAFTAFPGMATGVTAVGTAAAGASGPTGVFSAALTKMSFASLGVAIAVGLVIGLFILLVMNIDKLSAVGMEGAAALVGIAVGIYILSSALLGLSTIGIVGVVVLGLLVAEMVWFLSATTEAGEAVGAAFEQINAFLGKESALMSLGTTLRALGEAMADMNNTMSGGGLIGKGLNFIGLGGVMPTKKSPFAQMADDLQPIIDNADSLATVFGAMLELMNADIGSSFKDIASSVQTIYGELMAIATGPVEVKHTLENLARVASGNAGGGGFEGLIQAVNKAAAGPKEMKLHIELDENALRKLSEEGYLKHAAKVAG